jgi:hypothetical protein
MILPKVNAASTTAAGNFKIIISLFTGRHK